MALLLGIVVVRAYQSGGPPDVIGHSGEEIEVDDSGKTLATLAEEFSALDSRMTAAEAPADCKWIGKSALATTQARTISIDCPSTHPVLVSGSGSCYNSISNCDVQGQKVKYSRPRYGGGQYYNGWEVVCDQPAKNACALPTVYAFCCTTRIGTNLPIASLPMQ